MKEDKKYSIKKVFLWYWRTLPQYRKFYVFIYAIFGIGVIASDVIAPVFYKRIIDIITVPSPDIARLWQTIGILAGIYFFYYVLYRIGDCVYAYVETKATKDLAHYTFEKLHAQSYEFFTRESAGSLIAKSSRFIGAFEELLSDLTFSFWFNGLRFLGMVVVLYFISPFLANILLLSAITLFLLSYPFLKNKWKLDNLHSETSSKLTERMADVISNALTLKIFASFRRERKSFEQFTEAEANARKKSWIAFIKMSSLEIGLITLIEIGGLAVSLWLWQKGEISIGTVVLVLTYLIRLFDIIWTITNNVSRFMRHLSRASEMIEIFELTPLVLDSGKPKGFPPKVGKIEFDRVTFGYKDGNNVFEDFSLVVNPGEKVGLVGPSGAGKSTITKLLLRFFDPLRGEIRIEGVNIREARQDDLRKTVGYVPQEALLFHRTIGENVAYGKSDATAEEIVEAARQAEAHTFIERLPKGYDTMVGDRGVKLSGGERQRVAIARAILKNAPILILDEATSSLDSTSEVAIKKALDELMKGKTAIVIAHRLSTIQKMDRIVVLNKEGKIEEMGTHPELLAKGGLYAELWSHQAGGFIDEDSME